MFQSSFVLDRKLMYDLNGGEEALELLFRAGEITEWRSVEGGVLGRVPDPVMFLLPVSSSHEVIHSEDSEL
jgi:hypothetical protein